MTVATYIRIEFPYPYAAVSIASLHGPRTFEAYLDAVQVHSLRPPTIVESLTYFSLQFSHELQPGR